MNLYAATLRMGLFLLLADALAACTSDEGGGVGDAGPSGNGGVANSGGNGGRATSSGGSSGGSGGAPGGSGGAGGASGGAPGAAGGAGGRGSGGAGSDPDPNAPKVEIGPSWIVRTSDGNFALVGRSKEGYANAKIAPDGSVVWKQVWLSEAKPDPFSPQIRPSGVTAGPGGSFFVTGLALSPLPGETQHGAGDHFWARFDGDGALEWGHQIATSASSLGPWGIGADLPGNLYAGAGNVYAGNMRSTTEPILAVKRSAAGDPSYSLELTRDFQEAEPPLLTHWVEYHALRTDEAGNAYVLAQWRIFDASLLSDPGTVYLELQKIDADGKLVSATRVDTGSCTLQYIFSGFRWGLWTSRDGSVLYATGYDCLVKMRDTGEVVWTKPIESLKNKGTVHPIVVSPDGSSIYVSADASGNASMAATLYRFADDGTAVWSRSFPGTLGGSAGRFDVDADNAALLFINLSYVYSVATDGTGEPRVITQLQ